MKRIGLARTFAGAQAAHCRGLPVRTTKVPDWGAHQVPAMVRMSRPILSPESGWRGRFAALPATCGAASVLRNWWFAFACLFLLIAA